MNQPKMSQNHNPTCGPPQWRVERPWLTDLVVCDSTLPWSATFLPSHADLGKVLRRFHASGIDHISLTAASGKDDLATALGRLTFLRQTVSQLEGVTFAATAQDIRSAASQGLQSVSFHFQTTTPLQDNIDLVEPFVALGVVRALLAYNERNAIGDGCHEAANGGLSALGKRLISRMSQCGMTVDLSHCGERTSLDAIECSITAPVFSHSGVRALYEHERNISDAQIRACGARGGFIGINGVGFFLGAADAALPRVMSEHAAYIAELSGVDSVGLGLDFMYLEGSDYGFFHQGRTRWPRGYPEPPWSFFQPEQMGALVGELEKRGFDRQGVRKILGENYTRSQAKTAQKVPDAGAVDQHLALFSGLATM